RPARVELLEVLELTERLDRLEEVVSPALDREHRGLVSAGRLRLPAFVLVVGGAEFGQTAADLRDERIAVRRRVVGLTRQRRDEPFVPRKRAVRAFLRAGPAALLEGAARVAEHEEPVHVAVLDDARR